MAQHPVKAVQVQRWGAQGRSNDDLLAVEEPLEIRLEWGPADARQQRSIAVTMRTPGHDLELTAGFLHGEGIVRAPGDLYQLDWCARVDEPEAFGNVVKAILLPEAMPDLSRMERNFFMTSSCGVCGKASLEAVEQHCAMVPDDGWRVEADWIVRLPQVAEASQTVFKHTGGLHAATIFGVDGQLLVQREDVGRHNAVDKAIGMLWLEGRLAEARVLLVSGRAGFELVQKAAMAGIPLLAAVGAPSSLAVELAERQGMTLVGFLRGERFNVYAGGGRMA